eukprot:FR742364.1.p1 GENE.FR742364.1~~FR742364.1.p1  ORF type:complete len:117 (+),score=3.59 FR742364.1:187-537(+)
MAPKEPSAFAWVNRDLLYILGSFYVATTFRGIVSIGVFFYFAFQRKEIMPCLSLMAAEVLISHRITGKYNAFEVSCMMYLLLATGSSFAQSIYWWWVRRRKRQMDYLDSSEARSGR